MLSIERIEEMARDDVYVEPDPDAVMKAELVRQHHADHFGVEDPADGMSDDEIFDAMPKPWRKDG